MKAPRLIMAFSWMALILRACLPALAQDQQQSTTMNDGVACRRYSTIPVALAPGQSTNFTVSGELCATEDELAPGTTVQLLIHGATYNHSYWDFGKVNGIQYSYARDIAARGFPAFALDEIGAGESSHPPSDQVTIPSAAFVAHQIVQGLRDGSIGGVRFGKVITMGHSLGSVVAWQEAITYEDVEGVIVTGQAHSLTTSFINSGPFYPAVQDPRFSGSGLDSGYITTLPGIRAKTFLQPAPDADPAIIARDEDRKDVVSVTELGTALPFVTSTATLAIQVPVLTIVGSEDLLTCGPNTQGHNFDCSSGARVAAQAAPFYSPQAQIHACVIPGSGHDVSFAVNHRLQVADAAAWSFAFVGQSPFESNEADGGDQDNRGLPWNDGLPWNCSGPPPE